MAAGSAISIVFNALTGGFTSGMNDIQSGVSRATVSMGSLIKGAGAVGLAFAGITGIKEFASSMIDVTKQYDSMQAALSATVGAQNAKAVFEDLQNFAKETPFTLDEVTTAYQRMVNLGLNPSREAMLAYGNIAASIPNKSVTDFAEAVADAVTGENERLKEFGITAKKNGDMTAYTFQGVTKEVKNTKEEIEKYLISVSQSVAGGNALSNQAATLGGRMSALSDSFSQLQYNFMQSSGAAGFLGEAVEKLTDFVSYLNDLVSSGAGAEYFNAMLLKCQPLIDVVKDLYNWFLNLFPDNFGQSALDVLSSLWDDMMSFIELMRNFFGEGGLGKMMSLAGSYLMLLPNYVLEAVDKAIEYLKYFYRRAVIILKAVATAIKEGSISAGVDAYNQASEESKKQLDANLKSIEGDYKRTGDAIRENIDKQKDGLEDIVTQTSKNREEEKKAHKEAMAEGDAKLKQYKKEQEEKAKSTKDLFGDVGKGVVAKQMENAKNNPAPAGKTKKGSGGGGKSAAKEASEELKKQLDYQIYLEDDRYKQGETTAKQYYDKLLQLKLQQLGAENDASSQAYNENLKIINDTASTEKQKQKAIDDNTKLQMKMTGKSTEELKVRQEIANQLRDANLEFNKNINDLNKQLNMLSLGGQTATDTLNDFNDKYATLRKRIAAEDKENGTNNTATLDKLEKITIAMAKVEDNQRKINEAQSEYEKNLAEIKYLVESGAISSSEGTKREIIATNDLNTAKISLLETNQKLAESTDGYSKVAINGIKQQVAETKTAQIEISERMKDLSDGIFGSFDSAISAIVDKSKTGTEIVKDLFNDMAKTIMQTFTKGWSNDLLNMFTGSGNSGNSSGGFFSSIGSMLGSLFGSGSTSIPGHAHGGTAKPFTLSEINENGKEYLYTGAKPVHVMNASQTSRMGGGGSVFNINMPVTTKDANSMRQSQSQIIVEMQRNIQRQVNRNS